MGIEDQDRPLLQSARSAASRELPVTKVTSHTNITGTKVSHDDGDWQYAIVFNRVETTTETIAKPADVLKDIFTKRVLDAWSDQEENVFAELTQDPKVHRMFFVSNVWDKIVQILSGSSCGLVLCVKPTLDGSQVILLVKCRDESTIKQMADRMEMKRPLTREAYAVKGLTCPRAARTFGQIVGFNKTSPRLAPAYIPYDSQRSKNFKVDAEARLERAQEFVNRHIENALRDAHEVKADIRRLTRMEDKRAAVMAVLVDRLIRNTSERKPGEYENLCRLFNDINAAKEKTDESLKRKVDALKNDSDRFQFRLQSWSPPTFPAVEDFGRAELYQDFEELDIIRMVKYRIAQFVDLGSLERHGIVDSVFVVHRWADVQRLSKSWGSLSPRSILQWPGEQDLHVVRDYFGEEVAFFFHWLCFMTRQLIFPSVICVFVTLSCLSLSDDQVQILNACFAFVMCAWVAYLSVAYGRAATTLNTVWGMRGYADKGLQRATYAPELRGSWREFIIRGAHWLLAFLVVGQTIWSASAIANFRRDALNKQGEYWSLPWGTKVPFTLASNMGLYAVTANIKIMNFAWSSLSPRIVEYENWRTDQKLKNEQVAKAFPVKCVVYYYPFFYLAFVRDFVEGCHGDECVQELEQNLAVFIVTHLVSVVGNVVWQVASTWWAQRKATKIAALHKVREITYIQSQAMKPQYGGDFNDYMELSISLGFITMFSVVFPPCALLAFMSNLIEVRVLAFRMLRVVRRPVPRGQEGIGAWLGIMKFISYLASVTSVGLCIFALNPLKEGLNLTSKIGVFTIAEHVTVVTILMINHFVPLTSVTDEAIHDNHEIAEQTFLSAESQAFDSQSGSVEYLASDLGVVTPGTPLSP